MRRHRRGRRLLVPLVLALALGGAACGSSAGADDQVASATGTGSSAKAEGASDKDKVDAEQAGLDFARCMREHGVDMPDPQTGGGPGGGGGFIMVGPSEAGIATDGGPVVGEGLPEDFKAADEACRHILDDLIQEGGPPMDPEAQDRALAFARCMREHGVDMPDPDFSGGRGGFSITIGGPDGGIDPR
ncbi:MAG TPA: hypothetical protein VF244_09020, partial [Acidimicrobiales bacterium]